jgi:hypothetical protein
MSEASAAMAEGFEEESEEESEEALPKDAASVSKLARRQGAIALALLSLFAAADVWYVTTGIGFAYLLSGINGAVVGWVIGGMAHEWGHFAGARWGGGIAPTRPVESFFPIFLFDMERSDPSAFRAMSIGGNVAHWLTVLVFAYFIPLDTVGRMALLAGSFGFAVSASTTEFPIIRRLDAGATPAESFGGLDGEKLKRNGRIGMAAGLLLFLFL